MGAVSHLVPIDWVIIGSYMAISVAIGIYYMRRGRKSTSEYFASGGGVPWWLLGTSMVATTFASDTPLVLSGWVVTKGISQNWFWWCQVPITMAGVFFFARLWKRTHVLTDMEFVYARYSGKSASFLRGFKAVYLALPYNCLVMGWVNLAMAKIIGLTIPKFPRFPILDGVLEYLYLKTPASSDMNRAVKAAIAGHQVNAAMVYEKASLTAEKVKLIGHYLGEKVDPTIIMQKFDLAGKLDSIAAGLKVNALDLIYSCGNYIEGVHQYKILFFLFCTVVLYTTLSGLWGVLVTDFFQFMFAIVGCVILAVLAVSHEGGMTAIFHKMQTLYGADKALGMVSITPVKQAGGLALMPLSFFWIFILFAWYSVGFTDGGSYFAQRMISAKNERHAALGYLWFGVWHYALRMWPWIVVGLVAAVMFPYIPDAVTGKLPGGPIAEDGYIKVMLRVLPPGLLGMLVAAFLAAYMSTIATQINLGASYLLNDFYRPFIKKNAPEKHYVRVSMIATLVMAFFGIVISLYISTISEAWFLLSSLNAGIGIIYLLRWYWSRINAWTEVACISALIYLAIVLKVFEKYFNFPGFPYPINLLITVPVSFMFALLVTMLTKPVDKEKLTSFCKRVQSSGPGWKEIEDEIRKTDPEYKPKTPLTLKNLGHCAMAMAVVYCFLWGIGKIVIGNSLYPKPLIGNSFFGIILTVLGLWYGWELLKRRKVVSGTNGAPGMKLLIAAIVLIAGIIKIVNPGALVNLELHNSEFGILLILVGLALGYFVVQSFSLKKWSE
jgi:Na+/proline symporter